jgi:hypothetical protein
MSWPEDKHGNSIYPLCYKCPMGYTEAEVQDGMCAEYCEEAKITACLAPRRYFEPDEADEEPATNPMERKQQLRSYLMSEADIEKELKFEFGDET